MKEIDFLPEWYKSGKRRQISYRTQYVALAGIFVVMIVWNFITTHSISEAKAELAQMAAGQAEAESASAKYIEVKSKLMSLQKKADSIGKIDSKIDISSVLAELSYLIDEKIVLSKVRFTAEKFAGEQDAKPDAGSVVRVAAIKIGDKETLHIGDVRFKILISGVAADASSVASLICSIEDSPYFCQVIPSFSRNKEIQRTSNSVARDLDVKNDLSGNRESFHVSEFEISCYLANYREL